jgi:hypothetical protein
MILTIVMELSRRDAFREIVERLSGLMVEAGKADSARDRRRLLADCVEKLENRGAPKISRI